MNYSFLAAALLCLASLTTQQQAFPSVSIVNVDALDDPDKFVVIDSGKLNPVYNDTIFQSSLNCRNDNLEIFDNKRSSYIQFAYSNIPPLSQGTIEISISPNLEPQPYVQ